jgi:uncharacterized protein (TIGR03067 family)
MRRSALLLLALLSLAFAPAPLPRPAKRGPNGEELKKMQGTWALVSEREEGRQLRVGNVRAVIEDNDLTFFVGGKKTGEWTFTLNATTKPKALDMQMCPPGDLLIRAVYALEGDTLTICQGGLVPRRRPADLSGQGPLGIKQVWKRVKR